MRKRSNRPPLRRLFWAVRGNQTLPVVDTSLDGRPFPDIVEAEHNRTVRAAAVLYAMFFSLERHIDNPPKDEKKLASYMMRLEDIRQLRTVRGQKYLETLQPDQLVRASKLAWQWIRDDAQAKSNWYNIVYTLDNWPVPRVKLVVKRVRRKGYNDKGSAVPLHESRRTTAENRFYVLPSRFFLHLTGSQPSGADENGNLTLNSNEVYGLKPQEMTDTIWTLALLQLLRIGNAFSTPLQDIHRKETNEHRAGLPQQARERTAARNA